VRPAHVAVLLLSLLSCVTTTLGVLLALALRENHRALAAGTGFATGTMVLLSLFELLPTSIAGVGVGGALVSSGLGAAGIWAAVLVIPHTHLLEERGETRDTSGTTSAYLVVCGLILHDVPEGFAMANAYIASPGLGILIALAIALHNLPEQFAMAVPVVALRSRRLLFGTALLSALAEPLGAIVGLVAVGIAPILNAGFLAVAAGAMLFVAIHELIPMARRYRHPGLVLSGVGLAALVYRLLARAMLAWGVP
jgi:ZIP family zinc transporter